MNWYYESDGKPTGPVPESELQMLVAEGKISALTLVWSKGMQDWQPFHEAVSRTRFVEPDLSNPPETSGESTPSVENATNLASPIDKAHCVMPTWENRDGTSIISAFCKTLAEALTRPSVTFANLPREGSWGRPLAFYLMSGVCSFVFWTLTFYVSPPQNPPFPIPPVEALIAIGIPISILIFPMQAVFTTALLHFFIWITGSANRPFGTTFRIVTYAMGATSFLLLIPLGTASVASLASDPELTQQAIDLASYVMLIWSIIVLVKAIANAQAVSIWRASLAVLLPMILLCGIGILLALIVGGMQGM
ncbi:MAG: DUF4339 domain-containing protein [Verrucomicrobiota bacterium]